MRYIDADALKLDIDLSKGASVLDMAISVIRAVKDAPTADVAPKSEVERLQAEKDLLIRNYSVCIKEYANMIFAEIENLAKIYTFPVAREGFIEIEKEPFWCIDPSDLAELKKKYTGEGNDE